MTRLKYKIGSDEVRDIDTKLGKVTLHLSAAICFPHGVIGFDNLHYYCLCAIPEGRMPGALLMQSVEEEKLGFIILPLAEKFYKEGGALLELEDVRSAAESYDIREENLTVLVIASLSKEIGERKISINLKAPIFLDNKEKVAYQHVFIKNSYPLSFQLTA